MTTGMKIAISVPDELFEAADAYARRAKQSRSEVFAEAVHEYLERHDEDRVTAALDALAAEIDTSLEPDLARGSRRLLRRESW
jgi:metal-responsive CopG/Arc/MetJ family transcriptional regulator